MKSAVKLQYRSYVLNKLAKHFRMNVRDLKEDTEMNQEVIYVPTLHELGFRGLIYAAMYSNINMSQLLEGHKFLDSPIHEHLLLAEDMVPHKRIDDVLVAMYLGSSRIWLAKREKELYDGSGGIFVKTELGNFSITPMETYLTDNYPTEIIE